LPCAYRSDNTTYEDIIAQENAEYKREITGHRGGSSDLSFFGLARSI
jgi:hypothetical protein